jgi:hypothetical protein
METLTERMESLFGRMETPAPAMETPAAVTESSAARTGTLLGKSSRRRTEWKRWRPARKRRRKEWRRRQSARSRCRLHGNAAGKIGTLTAHTESPAEKMGTSAGRMETPAGCTETLTVHMESRTIHMETPSVRWSRCRTESKGRQQHEGSCRVHSVCSKADSRTCRLTPLLPRRERWGDRSPGVGAPYFGTCHGDYSDAICLVRRASLYYGRDRNRAEDRVHRDCWSGQRGASELPHLIANPPGLGGEQEEDEHDPTAVAGEQRPRIVGDHRSADTAAGASPRLLAYQLVALPAHPVAHAASPVLGSRGRMLSTDHESPAAIPQCALGLQRRINAGFTEAP